MLASQEQFLTSLPVNQQVAATALLQFAEDFNGFLILGKNQDLTYELRYAIACAAVNGYARMICQVGVNLVDEKVAFAEFSIDLTITATQGCTVNIIVEEPLAVILREKGAELSSFKMGTTEAMYIHPNLAYSESQRSGWHTMIVTVGYPTGDWFDIRRGEVGQSSYPHPVIELNPVPPSIWRRLRFASAVLLMGIIAILISHTVTLPVIGMMFFLYYYYKGMLARSVILMAGLATILAFWMR